MTQTCLFLFLTLLGFLGSLSPLILIPSYKIIVLLSGAIFLFFVLSLAQRNEMRRKPFSFTPLTILFLLFLLWSALGYIYSADPEKSILLTIQALSGVLLYLGLTLHIRNKNQLKTILQVLLFFGGILALIGLIQQFPIPFLENPISRGSNSTSLFVHRNVFAGYLLFVIPLSCLIYFSDSTKIWKFVAAISFILSCTALEFSGSRGGKLVFLLEVALIIGYLILKKDRKKFTPLIQGCILAVFLFFIIDFIIKGLGVDSHHTTHCTYITCKRFYAWGQSLSRVLFWQGAWEIFKDHWLIGSGPLSFAMLFPKYYISVIPLLDGLALISGNPPHAHNLFLQTASDSGLLGIGLLLGFLALFYWRAYKLLLNSKFKTQTTVFYITLAITSFLLHSIIEYNWPGPIFIYHFTIFIFVINFSEQEQISFKGINPSTKFSNIVPAFGILVLLFSLVLSVRFYEYHRILDENFLKEKNFYELKSWLAQAKEVCPRCDRPHLKVAEILLERYKANPNKKLLKAAKSELLEGHNLNPYNPYYLGYLGQILVVQGDYDRALSLIKEAAKFNRTHHINPLDLSAEQLRKLDHAKSR